MKVVTLTDKPTGKNPDVIELPRFAGNVMGITGVNQQTERPFEALLIVDAAGDYFAIPATAGMGDLRRYLESIASLDVAPYIELAYVGMDTLQRAGLSDSERLRMFDMKIKLIAWRFDETRDRPRSALRPKSPQEFPAD